MGNKKIKISFAQWGINEIGNDFLEKYWDYGKNTLNPYEIPYCMNMPKVWIKCLETSYHESYDIQCSNFVNGQRCGFCHQQRIHPKDSFAQYLVDNYGENALSLYWDYEANIGINPWEISKGSHKKVYMKCQNKDYHGSYKVQCHLFVKNNCCCPYCNHTKIHPLESFAQWCVDNIDKDFLEKYWDYSKNIVNPWGISPRTNKMVFLYCQEKKYHGSYEIRCNHFCDGNRCGYCTGKKVHSNDSFAQWGIDNFCPDFLEKYWDYEKNDISPYEIYNSSHKQVWVKCQEKDYHGSYQIKCESFISGVRCGFCSKIKVHEKDSFAQELINRLGENELDKYWDWDKNKISPWEIAPNGDKKIYIKCQDKDYHPSYEITCHGFMSGKRCPYCASKKVHPLDSFAQYHLNNTDSDFLNKYWDKDSNDNFKNNPWNVSVGSNRKIYIKCLTDMSHGSYAVTCSNFTRGNRCPICNESKGERSITELFNRSNMKHISQKEFDGLIGLGGGKLSYDFYLPQKNLLIEYQGEQHERYIKGFHNSKKDFERQQEHDRRKREYAEIHNIKLLEIWYWDYDNIEEILKSNNII